MIPDSRAPQVRTPDVASVLVSARPTGRGRPGGTPGGGLERCAVRIMLAAALAFTAVMSMVPARAVDRTIGAGIPKPVASGTPWTEAEIRALDANVDIALASGKAVRGAHVGIFAIDARDGRVLYERNQDDAFQPASTFKLLVGSAALEKLGPDFRFRTDVIANGDVANGVLQGELVLRGGGDPFLNAKDLDTAAAAVAAAGIARATGGVRIDDAHFEAPGYLPGWNWDDFAYYYAPVVSALTFEENVVHLTIAPGANPGDAATVTAAPVGQVGRPVRGLSADGRGARAAPCDDGRA